MKGYDAGRTVMRYELDVEALRRSADRLSEQLYYADVAKMDRETFELRHRRLLAEGRLGKARRLKEDFDNAQRQKAE